MIKLTEILNEDCWKGYKQIGGKMKNGKMVPNCVPESVEENAVDDHNDSSVPYGSGYDKVNEASMTVSIANIVKDLFPKEFFQVYKKNDVERVKSAITDLVKTLNRYYKQHNINVRFVDSNIKMKMYAKESAREDLTSSERLELYKLYSKAMKAMPQSPNQKKIIKKINVLRTKAGMKPLKEVTLNEIGIFNIHSYTKGILPSGYMDTSTPQKKEKYRSTVRDLMQTLNSFWKRNNIPFRVRK
jgi:Tfp pilus assembly protein PilE